MTRAVAALVGAVLLLATTLAVAKPLRPYEAPLFDETPVAPALPAEYLKDSYSGIHFAYHPSARERVRALMEECQAIRTELSALVGEPVLTTVDVRVAVGSSDFDRVAPAGAPPGAGAVAVSQARLLVMGLPSRPTTTHEVMAAFRRGMAYLALDEAAGLANLPRWVRVGFAVHFSGAREVGRSNALWWAWIEGRLVPMVDLDHHLNTRDDDSAAAAQAADFVAYLLEPNREAGWPAMVRAARDRSFEEAAIAGYQMSAASLETAWREDVAKHRAFVPVLVGSALLWLALIAGVQWRRRRRSRDEETEEPKKAKPKLVRVSKLKRRGPALVVPDPDVPKVSHNGRWHTLH